MRRFRFSLLSLLGFTGCIAVACAALIYASDTWAAVLFAFSIVAILLAGLTAMLRQGKTRAFGLGASLFGGAYLLLVYSPLLKSPPAGPFTVRWGKDASESITFAETADLPRLWTNAVLEFVYSKIQRRVPVPGGFLGPDVLRFHEGAAPGGPARGGGRMMTLQPLHREFRHVGHCLFTLLFAFCGGLIGCALSSSQRSKGPADD